MAVKGKEYVALRNIAQCTALRSISQYTAVRSRSIAQYVALRKINKERAPNTAFGDLSFSPSQGPSSSCE